MAEPVKLVTTPVEPLKVVVTERPDGPVSGTTVVTPAGQPNVEVVTMGVWKQVGIRVLRTYLQSLLGFILAVGTGAAGAVGINIPAKDFMTLIISSASLAVAPAVISLLQNAVEILTRLDEKNPSLRA